MSPLRFAIEQLAATRRYTTDLLEDLQPEDWFRQPAEGVTHIAWQVGHLTIAEYGLVLRALRGKKPEDAELFSKRFLVLFNRETRPEADAAKYPPPEELRAAFDKVHERALSELEALSDDDILGPVAEPSPLYKTKQEAVHFCARHEMVHAGQIGLLRRLLGREWLR